jgi:hypothetical protein
MGFYLQVFKERQGKARQIGGGVGYLDPHFFEIGTSLR